MTGGFIEAEQRGFSRGGWSATPLLLSSLKGTLAITVFTVIVNVPFKKDKSCAVADRPLLGFRAGKWCVGQIFTLKQISEKAREKKRRGYVSFIDEECVRYG